MFIVQYRKNIRVEIRQQKEWVKLSYLRLNQSQNESKNLILWHGHLLEKTVFLYALFHDFHLWCWVSIWWWYKLIYSISLFHHKELEKLKNIWAWKAAAIKVTTKYKKTESNIAITENKEKQLICHIPGVFSNKVINFTSKPSM